MLRSLPHGRPQHPFLAPQLQLFQNRTVTLDVPIFQIVKHTPPLTHQF